MRSGLVGGRGVGRKGVGGQIVLKFVWVGGCVGVCR